MRRARVAVVGGGLAGLFASQRLGLAGVHDHVVLEARPRWGGRILSVAGTTDADRFDLGPTWFWPGMQPELDALVHALGLPRFAQHEAGDLLVERPGLPLARLPGHASEPPSMRLAGGMGALVDRLRQDTRGTLLSGQVVSALRRDGEGVVVEVTSDGRPAEPWQVDGVLLALPPRLAARDIAFTPGLPPALRRAWQHTPTWMAPHAKWLAVYPRPFWREQGLSGGARSGIGPMVEIHDAGLPGGAAALFGFIGVPARSRQRVPPDALGALCRAQLVRLFGPAAGQPLAEHLQDWAAEPFTATDADLDGGAGHHAAAPPAAPDGGPWQGRLWGIGSEWSPSFPGYLAGAVEAAGMGVTALLRVRG